MRFNDLSPGESGQPRAPLLLPIVRLLVLTITWATPAASFAVSFSLVVEFLGDLLDDDHRTELYRR